MASRTKYLYSQGFGLRYLRFLYWTPIARYRDRYALVFSLGEGEEALAFFNATNKSPRGKLLTGNKFFAPPHGEFSRWYDEVAKFPAPRSNGERCNGLKRLLSTTFFEGDVTYRWDDFGNKIYEINLKTLRPCPEFPAKNGWAFFENNGKRTRKKIEHDLSESDEVPF